MKSNYKNFVHLVGLYTYCKMMHGVYNIKLINAQQGKRIHKYKYFKKVALYDGLT